MTIDEFSKLVQIVFYITASTVAVLTYLSAKRGLLNTVNTEFHKRAFDKIEALSQELFSEFDPQSANYWGKDNTAYKMMDEIYQIYQNEQGIIETSQLQLSGIPPHPVHDRLYNLLRRTKTDPFIPAKIRDYISDHLEKRSEAILEIYMQEFGRYYDELNKGEVGKSYQNDAMLVHNRINSRLYSEGYGVSQIEEKVHDLRKYIQAYLEGFNPLKK